MKRTAAVTTALACLAGAVVASGCGGVETESSAGAAVAPPRAVATSDPAAGAIVPPRIKVTTPATQTSPGYLFVAPKRGQGEDNGPLIYDNLGQPVWFKPLSGQTRAYDFRVQRYQGKPVLTWWEGVAQSGFGQGVGVIYDDHYRQIATVKTGNGLKADFHEFLISPRNTAYLIAYAEGPRRDTRRWGGTKRDRVLDNVIQEIDIKTGKVLFQWKGLDHISPGESYQAPPKDPNKPWDPLHINSIQVLPDGNLLISVREPHTTYKINRRSGKVMWRMGGKKSDFKMAPGTRTAWQHDAQRLPNGDYTWFDNNSVRPTRDQGFARGLQVKVDEKARKVTMVRAYGHTPPEVSHSQANMQTLPNGDKLIGWGGSQPNLTEYGPDGGLRFEAQFAAPGADTYRAYRFPWVGVAPGAPALTVDRTGGQTTATVRWNGATEVESWRVLSGSATGELVPGETVGRTGFDTVVPVDPAAARVAVEALDTDGSVIGRSPIVDVPS